MPEPTPAAPTRPAPSGLVRVTAVIAFVGVLVSLLGLVLLLRPVETPVQDCGTALAFVLRGRVNVKADPADPPKGLTAADVEANNERPCRQRVAGQIKLPLLLLTVGLLVAVVATAVEMSSRLVAWRHRARSARAGGSPPSTDGPRPTPAQPDDVGAA